MLCCFSGFFFLYNTSKRAKLSPVGTWDTWIQAHPVFSKQIGIALIVLSFIVLIWKDGAGVGAITASLLLMTAGSCMIILAPFHYLRLKHILFISTLSFILELLIF